MRSSSLLLRTSVALFLPALSALLWLYLYPAFKQCAFPSPIDHQGAIHSAPFRLLTLADPQLEGDTSLPDPDAPQFPSLQRLRKEINNGGFRALQSSWPLIRDAAILDAPAVFQGYRKRLDLLGNDYYLAHVYRSMHWWTQPTHVVVLGDLLGSQWIDDAEFRSRVDRYWHRVFAGASLVPIETTATSARIEVLGADKAWSKRVIAVVGNHDIGYAGDIDSNRVARFENAFGHVNWETRFLLDTAGSNATDAALPKARRPELRLMVINTMNIDEPVQDSQLRDETLMFIGRSFSAAYQRDNKKEATVVLTHIPFHKEAGVCVDAPYFSYFSEEYGGGIREQNHLRPDTTQRLLSGLGPRAIILNGHDHEGCDTIHLEGQAGAEENLQTSWIAARYSSDNRDSGVREITVRSMMGSYGGNAGLLSGWYDTDKEAWRFEYSTCAAGVQHIWWAVHVLAIVEILLVAGGSLALVIGMLFTPSSVKQKRE